MNNRRNTNTGNRHTNGTVFGRIATRNAANFANNH